LHTCYRPRRRTRGPREAAHEGEDEITTTTAASERTAEVAGLTVRMQESGTGPPLWIIHHSTGNPLGWIPLYEQLAQRFTVTVPDLPGYGRSDRPDWAREPRDLAVVMLRLLDRLDVEAPLLVGFGFGGFIAAELATMAPRRLSGLVLVGAAGVRPPEGEIMDQMLIGHDAYVRAGHADDASFASAYGSEDEIDADVKDVWDFSRIMTARVTWNPYMHSRRLPHLLQEITTPTLVVWGEHDRVIPRSAGELYAARIPGARLEVVADAGHHVDVEQPAALAELIGGLADGA
jgi:pimeloyl-ACP methyl ester carboxylesterase